MHRATIFRPCFIDLQPPPSLSETYPLLDAGWTNVDTVSPSFWSLDQLKAR